MLVRFLAVLGLASSLSPAPPKRVVVVGAGMGGLALAGRLAHHVVVLEDVLPEPALKPFHGGPLPSFESVLPGAWASTGDVGVR